MRSHFPVRTHFQQCHDLRGEFVSTIRFDELRDVAHAVIMNKVPYIVLNPTRLATLPPKLQAFFYEHECAHHLLGHNYNPTLSSEPEADCLAVKSGRDRGLFTRADVVAFRPWIVPLRGSMRGHLPGKKRFALLMQCFDDSETDKNLAERMQSALATTARLRRARSIVHRD
ncbi:MAG: hypothetical protein K0U34_03330 [Alphaproteobacteria bacterium]|nr:hypothetical protein [Alphaproteobacteria bacterium]